MATAPSETPNAGTVVTGDDPTINKDGDGRELKAEG